MGHDHATNRKSTQPRRRLIEWASAEGPVGPVYETIPGEDDHDRASHPSIPGRRTPAGAGARTRSLARFSTSWSPSGSGRRRSPPHPMPWRGSPMRRSLSTTPAHIIHLPGRLRGALQVVEAGGDQLGQVQHAHRQPAGVAAPPRRCRMQPGLSVTTTLAPVASMFAQLAAEDALRRRRRYSSEKEPPKPQQKLGSCISRISKPSDLGQQPARLGLQAQAVVRTGRSRGRSRSAAAARRPARRPAAARPRSMKVGEVDHPRRQRRRPAPPVRLVVEEVRVVLHQRHDAGGRAR